MFTFGDLTLHAARPSDRAFIVESADDWYAPGNIKGSDMSPPMRAGRIPRRRRRDATVKTLVAAVSGHSDAAGTAYHDQTEGLKRNLLRLQRMAHPRQSGDGTLSVQVDHFDGLTLTGTGHVVDVQVERRLPDLARATIDVELPDGVLYGPEVSWVIARDGTTVDQYPSYYEGYGLVGPDGGLILPGTSDAFEARIEVTDGGGSDWFAVDNANFTDPDGNPLSIGVDRGGGQTIEGVVVDCGKLTATLNGTNLIGSLTRTIGHEEWLPLEPDVNALTLRGADEALIYVRPVYG